MGTTSSGFAQNTIHDFTQFRIKLIAASSWTNVTKLIDGLTFEID